MSINVTLSLDREYLRKMDEIVKRLYTDRSKLLRKWIDQNYKEDYKSGNKDSEEDPKPIELGKTVLNNTIDLNDAGQIIRDLDPQYDFKGKSGIEIRDHAKKLKG